MTLSRAFQACFQPSFQVIPSPFRAFLGTIVSLWFIWVKLQIFQAHPPITLPSLPSFGQVIDLSLVLDAFPSLSQVPPQGLRALRAPVGAWACLGGRARVQALSTCHIRTFYV